MGTYINPKDRSKEDWLEEYGTPISATEALTIWQSGKSAKYLPVCLVDNGPFTAAAVATCLEDAQHYASEDDPRSRQWFLVPREALRPFYSEAA